MILIENRWVQYTKSIKKMIYILGDKVIFFENEIKDLFE